MVEADQHVLRVERLRHDDAVRQLFACHVPLRQPAQQVVPHDQAVTGRGFARYSSVPLSIAWASGCTTGEAPRATISSASTAATTSSASALTSRPIRTLAGSKRNSTVLARRHRHRPKQQVASQEGLLLTVDERPPARVVGIGQHQQRLVNRRGFQRTRCGLRRLLAPPSWHRGRHRCSRTRDSSGRVPLAMITSSRGSNGRCAISLIEAPIVGAQRARLTRNARGKAAVFSKTRISGPHTPRGTGLRTSKELLQVALGVDDRPAEDHELAPRRDGSNRQARDAGRPSKLGRRVRQQAPAAGCPVFVQHAGRLDPAWRSQGCAVGTSNAHSMLSRPASREARPRTSPAAPCSSISPTGVPCGSSTPPTSAVMRRTSRTVESGWMAKVSSANALPPVPASGVATVGT